MVNQKDYDYLLPEKNLALMPAVPRDSSKLFVYNTSSNQVILDQFLNIDKYLPKESFLVLNKTKVMPARAVLKKETGGKIVILFLVNEPTDSQTIKTMVDRKVEVGDKLFFDGGEEMQVLSQNENLFVLGFDFEKEKLFELLNKYGSMPIPPYLKKTPLKRDELMEKYQTIFASRTLQECALASAAAPTASLHFTERAFNKLDKKEIQKFFVTLHVGLGTFAPITEQNIINKKLHEEYFEVEGDSIQLFKTLRSKGKKLVAVGTTVVRTLESIAKNQTHSSSAKQLIFDKTDLFIFPPYNFKMVDVMITNFHLPKSSLMMLVEAFLQYKGAKKHLVDLYKIAIENDFRFFSFGDSMLIL